MTAEPSKHDLLKKGSSRFRVTQMFHPSHHVTDLAEAENWFQRTFGRQSATMAMSMRRVSIQEGLPPPQQGYPTDYSIFTPISDVLFDSIDPKRYVLSGRQRYPTVERPTLRSIGWYVDGMGEAYRELRQRGFRITNQLGDIVTAQSPPSAVGRPVPLFFTLPEDAGLSYEFFPAVPFPLDPRVTPGWSLPPVSDDDPLGIERCSHHTVVTEEPSRALRLVVEGLGGTIVHTGRNEILQAESTYVHLAGSILEYAVLDACSSAEEHPNTDRPNDTYYSITWKVLDLERVKHHLESAGVGIRTRSIDTIVTDPDTSLGIPWGFTSRSIPGDPRV